MANRQARRRLKRLGLLSHIPDKGIQPQTQSKPRWWERQGWQIFLGATTLVGFVLAVFSFRTTLDVSTSIQRNPSDPYSELFIVSNNGLFSLYNVEILCLNEWYKDAAGNVGKMNLRQDAADTIKEFIRGAKRSVYCRTLFSTGAPIFETSISLIIRYQTLLPFYTNTKPFHFIGIRTKDGQVHWTPQFS